MRSKLNGVAAGMPNARQDSEAWHARDLAGLWSIRPSLSRDCRWSHLSLSANGKPSMIRPSLPQFFPLLGSLDAKSHWRQKRAGKSSSFCRSDLTRNTNPTRYAEYFDYYHQNSKKCSSVRKLTNTPVRNYKAYFISLGKAFEQQLLY